MPPGAFPALCSCTRCEDVSKQHPHGSRPSCSPLGPSTLPQSPSGGFTSQFQPQTEIHLWLWQERVAGVSKEGKAPTHSRSSTLASPASAQQTLALLHFILCKGAPALVDIGQGNPAAIEEDKKEDEIFTLRKHQAPHHQGSKIRGRYPKPQTTSNGKKKTYIVVILRASSCSYSPPKAVCKALAGLPLLIWVTFSLFLQPGNSGIPVSLEETQCRRG